MNETLPKSGQVPNKRVASNVRPPAIGQWLKLVSGYLLAVAGLIWALHDFRFTDLIGQLTQLKWQFVVAASLCDVLGYLCQGLALETAAEKFRRNLGRAHDPGALRRVVRQRSVAHESR
jgi:hypothetical protein